MEKNIKAGDEGQVEGLRIRVRFDYKGVRAGKLFGGKSAEQVAEEVREQKVAFLRNVPFQGIHIEDIDLSPDVYTVMDEFSGQTVGFAPANITFWADSLDDALRFIVKEEFRKVEVLEPDQAVLTRYDMERLLFKANEALREFKVYMRRKLERS
ncbi:conserved hypothetical protein [Syntrophothermus lipocalidus DSM 12680]|uniref:Uncharacterized protein n=1 Tax=Syntrophothermus lipocalidus (strain DSM 12680 / TGB-C1) TaxID=643648 RepID=D7CP97_SYNLT|nr:conserved hypothetical protein [Syntrophothermus lipocalidus DSM 12680]